MVNIMSKKTVKKVSFLVQRGIRINGVSLFPAKPKAKPVIISLPETLAKELAYASKGKIVEEKPTKDTPAEQTEDDDLAGAFGEESDGKE